MDSHDAAALIRPAIPRTSGVWADLGAGTGTFTRALAHLLPHARIYAVDRDASALGKLLRWLHQDGVTVVPVRADFTEPLDFPELGTDPLDGYPLCKFAALRCRPRPGVEIPGGSPAAKWTRGHRRARSPPGKSMGPLSDSRDAGSAARDSSGSHHADRCGNPALRIRWDLVRGSCRPPALAPSCRPGALFCILKARAA